MVSCDASVPKWLWTLLATALAGTMLLACRLVYEQTVLTWREGAQVVGFTLMHVFPFLFLWMLLTPATLLFIVIWGLVIRSRGSHVPKQIWLLGSVLCLFFALLFVPYDFWMAASVRIAGPGRHGDSFLMIAAVDGKPAMVRALVESGVSPNASGGGSTALEWRAATGGPRWLDTWLVKEQSCAMPLAAHDYPSMLESYKRLTSSSSDGNTDRR